MNRLRNAQPRLCHRLRCQRKAHRDFPVCESEYDPELCRRQPRLPGAWPPTTATPITTACWSPCARDSSKRLSFGISYTWSHNFCGFVDNLTGGSTPASAYNYSLERSQLAVRRNPPVRCQCHMGFPIGKGGMVLNSDHLASRLIGGWQVNSIVTLETGTPFTVSAPDVSATGGSHASRASCIGDPYSGATSDPSQFVGSGATGFFLNPAAFTTPAGGYFGNCAPRAFHGPGIQNVDLSLFKRFPITESWRVEFRTRIFQCVQSRQFPQPERERRGIVPRLFREVLQHCDRPPRDPVRAQTIFLTAMRDSSSRSSSWRLRSRRRLTSTLHQAGRGRARNPGRPRLGGPLAEPQEAPYPRQPDHDHRPSR